ncbi:MULTISPECIES: AIPR family protein [unclassified Corynebacterium]|uniref:AIPR family protein n=1 Tax=unclassified Corynebacterium TaxID=2624378 RepID=UPI0008A5CB9D|nr:MULTISPECIES: AIPR family protein [unclassified Corynebacterium]MBC6757901.1 hypothetical protein [Corynebacterium sp. LK24]OFN08278.1 hypothetical protein HMPREF2614_00705 [Corynebacterium sp. HMSC074C11]
MGTLHITKIKTELYKEYAELRQELQQRLPNDEESSILTKLLAGHALFAIGGIQKEKLADHIVDGPNDRGIDALFYSQDTHTITFVQSKWQENPKRNTSFITERDASEFANGLDEFIHMRLCAEGNERIKKLEDELDTAIYDFALKINVVVITTATSEINQKSKNRLDRRIEEIGSDQVELKLIDQKGVYGSFDHAETGAGVTFQLSVSKLQDMSEPYPSWYGAVSGEDIAKLVDQHGDKLFAKNLRNGLGRTDINDGIRSTAQSEPESFWYFNNGITITAERIRRTKMGGLSSDFATFKLTNASIVNGAQTSQSLFDVYNADGDVKENLKSVKCLVRLIELPEGDEVFQRNVTQYNNSQNPIGFKDFVSLEEFQVQLRAQIDKEYARTYWIRSGDSKPDQKAGDFDLQDATIALTCSGCDVRNVVRAKSSISTLWKDLSRPPYTEIFDESRVTPTSVVKAVDFLHYLDEFLANKAKSDLTIYSDDNALTLKERLPAIHGNRLFEFLVMRNFDIYRDRESADVFERQYNSLDLDRLFSKFCQTILDLYPESHIGYLFKNQEKCLNIADSFGAFDPKSYTMAN